MTPAPAPDWPHLAALLEAALAAFGAPRDLWDDRVIERGEGLALRAWLRALEGMARALLLVMALGMKLVARSRRRKTGTRAAAPALSSVEGRSLDADAAPPETPDSALWAGVAFRLTPPRPGTDMRAGAGPRFLPCRALAFRLEALIRVAQEPARYARRLARRLAATGPAALAPRLLSGEPHGGPTGFKHDLDAARGEARLALVAAGGDTS